MRYSRSQCEDSLLSFVCGDAVRGWVTLVSGLTCHARLAFAGSGPLTAGLVKTHHGPEARFTTNRDYDQPMAVCR
jgi:hypothetical protein